MLFHRVLVISSFMLSQWIHPLSAGSESAQKIKETEEQIRVKMVDISRQLGVTCTECHNLKNLKDASLKSYQVGREHLRLVELLTLNGMDGKKGPQATCYMCHQGQLRYNYREKMKSSLKPPEKTETPAREH